MKDVVIIKVGELHLKGQNRPFFERMLLENLRRALPFPVKLSISQSRIFLYNLPEGELPNTLNRLQKVFGVHALCPARETEKTMEAVTQEVLELLRGYRGTFRVHARRADKTFPLTSPELACELGGRICQAYPHLQVDLSNPGLTVELEIREKAYVYAGQTPGPGGMPVGTNGKALLLLSGGIDSPVAGWMIAKRGVQVQAVHFYSFPHTSERAKEKVITLCRQLAPWCRGIQLHIVPFTQIQETLYKHAPDKYLTVLMRRAMMQIAERIALRESCGALVTGESIGQVASQTLEALHATDNAVNLPVFRPLIGFDKSEITERAEKIGTFATSILPYEDCCTVFTPRHPATHPELKLVQEAEAAALDPALLEEAVIKTEVLVFNHFGETP